mgnify:CR=1 FL=1
MPSIRSGFGSDFVLKNENIGIGSTTPTSALDVAGAIKGNFVITGVATLTSYGGFVAQNQHINKASSIGFATVGLQTGAGIITSVQYYETETGFTDLGGVHHGDDQKFNTLSEDLIIDDGQILNITSIDMVGVTTIGEYDPHSHESYVCAGSLEQVSVTDHFSVPSGGINDRKDNPIEGTVRFNTDLNTLEFFNGNEWRQFNYNQGQSGRVVIAGGYGPLGTPTNTTGIKSMQSLQVMTLGNTQYFGELNQANTEHIGCGSEIRGILAGGYVAPARVDIMQYVTMASASSGIDFGNLTQARNQAQAVSSSTRGIWGGGFGPSYRDEIDYVEISTVGNALDFGDLSFAHAPGAVGNSPTRGVFLSGYTPSNPYSGSEFISIASKGNGVTFGECSTLIAGGSCGSNTRGIFGGGYTRNPASASIKTLQYVTMASFGNAVEFGNLVNNMTYASSGGNAVRGIFTGSDGSPYVNTNIDYVSVTSLGNAEDFGDLSIKTGYAGAVSDSHGGLGGF